MLTIPPGSSPIVSVIGIDPGSDTLGVANLRFHLETLAIVSTDAMTLHAARGARHSWTTEMQGDRWGRIQWLHDQLLEVFNQCQPLEIASEAPFINRRQPQAGLALTEVVALIRHAVTQYDIWKKLYMIDPPTVKVAVGAPGHIGGERGKQNVKEGVARLAPILNYNGNTPLDQLDEHSNDAIAVAYCRYRNLLDELCLRT